MSSIKMSLSFQTSASSEFEFQGHSANPRNLTLWFEKSGTFMATIAELYQEFSRSSSDRIETREDWTCRTFDDQIRFSTFYNRTFDTIIDTYDEIRLSYTVDDGSRLSLSTLGFVVSILLAYFHV